MRTYRGITKRHWRRAREAGPRRRMQAADLWLEFGTDEAAKLLGLPTLDLLCLVALAAGDEDW